MAASSGFAREGEASGRDGGGDSRHHHRQKDSQHKHRTHRDSKEGRHARDAGQPSRHDGRGQDVPSHRDGRGGNTLRPSSSGRSIDDPRIIDALRQALTVGFANRIARRLRRHNGYNRMAEAGQLAHIHPGSSALEVDEEGLYPEWLVYHELVATTRPFLRQVSEPRCGLHTLSN